MADGVAAATMGSLAASDGHYRIAQVVLDPPDDLVAAEESGAIGTVLAVNGDRMTLELVPLPSGASGALGAVNDANVVVVLSYADAAALSRGELDPVQALSTGNVRVRGDLSVLVAGQAMLASAASAIAGLHADTTY